MQRVVVDLSKPPEERVSVINLSQQEIDAINAAAAANEATRNTPEALRAYAAAKRWEVETGGCIWSTYTIATDRDSQAKLIAEFVSIGAGLRIDPSPWKFANAVFVSLSNTDMGAVIMAARTHIAACFAAEAAVLAAITAGTITTRDAIDAWAWPSNG